MDANNQSMMVEGANPDMLWMQHIDYLATQSKIMKKEYIRRKRANKPFTWNDLDVMNKKIHHDLDVVMSCVENVQENKQNTNMNKKLIRLTESDLHRIVKESVNRILDEGWSSYVDYYYPDNEKESKENNYFNPEKAKREPSKSSRVRRREYMKNKQKIEQS
jgi:hypothetical protein